MKRSLFVLLVICGFLLFTSPGWALNLLDATDVGSIDTFIASDNLANYGEANELAWINDTLLAEGYFLSSNDFFTSFNKYDYQPDLYQVYDGGALQSGVYAFELQTDPAFFMVKWGDANGAYDGIALWANLAEFNWGVMDLLDTPGLNILNIGAFSHWGEAGGSTSVPEPSTILLLGLGLVGLAGIGRKNMK